MTDLFDRMFGVDSDIAIHPLHAAVVDYMSGNTSRSQIVAAWSMDAEAQSDLDALLDAVDALTTIEEKLRFAAEMESVMILVESGLKYTTKAAFATRLGL